MQNSTTRKNVKTRRSAFTALALVAAGLLSTGLVVTGCGSGGSDNSPILSVSRFAGTWSGDFTASTGQTGQTQVVITDTGGITGISVNTVTDGQQQGPAAGSIDANGLVNINFTYSGFTINGRGTLVLNSAQNGLTGTLTRIQNGTSAGNVLVTLHKGTLQSF